MQLGHNCWIDPSSDDDLPRIRRLVATAGHTGTVEVARCALDHAEPSIRSVALGALQRTDALEDGELRAALADESAVVRKRAALIAATRNGPIDALIELLDDSDDTVVEVAAFAIGEIEGVPPAGIDALSTVATDHPDSLCRESACAALGAIGDEGGLHAVLKACTDRAPVRRRAVLALAAFEGPEITQMLATLSNDRDLQVRQAAEELLAIEGGEAL